MGRTMAWILMVLFSSMGLLPWVILIEDPDWADNGEPSIPEPVELQPVPDDPDIPGWE